MFCSEYPIQPDFVMSFVMWELTTGNWFALTTCLHVGFSYPFSTMCFVFGLIVLSCYQIMKKCRNYGFWFSLAWDTNILNTGYNEKFSQVIMRNADLSFYDTENHIQAVL